MVSSVYFLCRSRYVTTLFERFKVASITRTGGLVGVDRKPLNQRGKVLEPTKRVRYSTWCAGAAGFESPLGSWPAWHCQISTGKEVIGSEGGVRVFGFAAGSQVT